MKVLDARFVKSVFTAGDIPQPTFPEIAFAGRSNVGKSSLINTLLNRKKIAKTSSTPGRTQSINFIAVNEALYFVDLPGYGYARVPVKVKQSWQPLVDRYLEGRPALRLVVLIVDARRSPTDDEAAFVQWMALQGIAFAVVTTKIDKLKKTAQQKSMEQWKRYLQVERVHPFSALKGLGKEGLWHTIDAALQRGGNNTA